MRTTPDNSPGEHRWTIELYNELRKINKKLKVCFITAFDVQKDDLNTLSASNGNLVIIRKPIAIADLVKKVKLEIGSNQA